MLAVSDIFTTPKFWIRTHVPRVSPKGHAFNYLKCNQRRCSHQLFSIFVSFSHIAVTRASREGSEDPGWGGHVSDRKKSPGAIAEEELLQWRPSLFHGDSAKCDGHLQKSNLHPSSRRRAGEQSLEPQSVQKVAVSETHLQHLQNVLKCRRSIFSICCGLKGDFIFAALFSFLCL